MICYFRWSGGGIALSVGLGRGYKDNEIANFIMSI